MHIIKSYLSFPIGTSPENACFLVARCTKLHRFQTSCKLVSTKRESEKGESNLNGIHMYRRRLKLREKQIRM
jgi:hypothetical protein